MHASSLANNEIKVASYLRSVPSNILQLLLPFEQRARPEMARGRRERGALSQESASRRRTPLLGRFAIASSDDNDGSMEETLAAERIKSTSARRYREREGIMPRAREQLCFLVDERGISRMPL